MGHALRIISFLVLVCAISAQFPNTGMRPIGGQIPGQFGATQFGTIPGQIPGTIPGQIPGTIPGQIPGTIPGQIGTIPGQMNTFGTFGTGLNTQFGSTIPGVFPNNLRGQFGQFGTQFNQFGRNVPSLVPGGQIGGFGATIPNQFGQFTGQFGNQLTGQIPGQFPGQFGQVGGMGLNRFQTQPLVG